MTVLLWGVLLALGLALMGFTAFAATIGGIGALIGARFERCPGCGRHGLVINGSLHAHGCPPDSGVDRLRHLVHNWTHGIHFGHHS